MKVPRKGTVVYVSAELVFSSPGSSNSTLTYRHTKASNNKLNNIIYKHNNKSNVFKQCSL